MEAGSGGVEGDGNLEDTWKPPRGLKPSPKGCLQSAPSIGGVAAKRGDGIVFGVEQGIGNGFRSGLPGALVLALAACASVDDAQTGGAQDEAAVRAQLEAIETSFNSGDFEAFIGMYAEDAVIIGQGYPDTVGRDAIRALYEGALAQVDMRVDFKTEELVVAGDLAYERGTFQRDVLDKTTGALIESTEPRHIHILRRGADGEWRTWRLMTNEAAE